MLNHNHPHRYLRLARRNTSKSAFTLIELLVVVTIIVVLLALLAPAMDRAVYQAELASCGAHQKAIATGAVTYAMAFKRWYPYRIAPSYPREIKQATAATDDRPKLMPFIPLELFLDPLCGKIDLSMDANDADTRVHSNYDLFFGFRFAAGGRTMQRLGQQFRWLGDTFNVLTMDHDRSYGPSNLSRSNHPDAGGTLWFYHTQNVWQVTLPAGLGGGAKWTESSWSGVVQRPPVDENVAFDDASVIRYNNVAYNQYQIDARFSRVPDTSTATAATSAFEQLPVQAR